MDVGLADWLSRLGPLELVEVLRDVLAAEANRVGGGPGVVHFSREINRRDGGVDGTTDLPAGARPIFCPGPRTWQVKSGADPGTGISAKPRTREHLAAGRDYVLCWSGDDPVTSKKEDVETGLREWLGEHYPGRTATVLTVPDLVRMVEHTPAVVHRHGGPLFLGYTVEEWGRSLRVEAYPFVSDSARDDVMAGLRAFALDAEPYASRHIVGDTGVGKSRVVFEALNVDGLREITSVVSDVDAFDRSTVRAAMTQPYARMVLVVDDVTDAQLEGLRTLAAAAAGRLRLITIGGRGTPRNLGGDTNVFDLRPLPEGRITALLDSAARPHLDPTWAAQVAELAEGYPRLAVALAETIAAEPASARPGLLNRYSVGTLLTRMLSDETTRQALAALALFDRIGVDRDVSYELEALASTFGFDPFAMRAILDTEQGRFVSTAGPYRHVTPRAFAVWLVTDLARRQPTPTIEAITGLPEPLLGAFRRQLQFLGGDVALERVLEGVTGAFAGRFRHAEGTLTGSGAAFLHSLAYAVPQLAMRHLTAALTDQDVERLRAQEAHVRREVVWALEHLAWFTETWRPAADLLLRLAMAETETFGDNATGTLIGTFLLHLGGTATPYRERLRWWDLQYADAERSGDTAKATLLARVLAAGLNEHESRSGAWHGVLQQPAEYRPSREDAIALRDDIWRRLLDLTSSAADQDVVTEMIAGYLPMAVRYPFAGQVLDRVVGLSDLTPGRRAALGDALRAALQFDGGALPASIRQAVEAHRVVVLGGPGVLDRLPAILSTPVWHLDDPYTGEPPQVLVDSADALLATANLQLIEVALRQPDVHEQTLYALALLLGRRAETGTTAPLLKRPTLPSSAFTGLLRGLAEHAPDDADAHLRAWLGADSLLQVLAAVPHLPATVERARIALEANRRAHGLPGRSVNRLAFGSWLNPLPSEIAADVIDALITDSSRGDASAVEAGMFAVFTYLDHVGGLDLEALPNLTRRRFEAAALRLIDSYDTWTGPIRDLSFLRAQLVRHLRLDPEQQLTTALAGLISDQRDYRHTLEAMREACLAVGERSIGTVLSWLLGLPGIDILHLRGAHLVTLLETTFGPEPVLTAMQLRTDDEQATLLGQVDFSGSLPELALRLIQAGGPRARTEAVTRYMYPGTGFIGSYASYLLERRAALEPMREQAIEVHGPASNLASFLGELSDALDAAITSERHQD